MVENQAVIWLMLGGAAQGYEGVQHRWKGCGGEAAQGSSDAQHRWRGCARLQIALSCACGAHVAICTLRAGSRISRYCPLARSSATPLEPEPNGGREGAPRLRRGRALLRAWLAMLARPQPSPAGRSRPEVTIAGVGRAGARPRTGLFCVQTAAL